MWSSLSELHPTCVLNYQNNLARAGGPAPPLTFYSKALVLRVAVQDSPTMGSCNICGLTRCDLCRVNCLNNSSCCSCTQYSFSNWISQPGFGNCFNWIFRNFIAWNSWWRLADSNRSPTECKSVALPDELNPHVAYYTEQCAICNLTSSTCICWSQHHVLPVEHQIHNLAWYCFTMLGKSIDSGTPKWNQTNI